MLVLITGKAQAGKDTIGEYLRIAYGFKTDSLAAPIKRLVQDIFVLPHDVVYDRKKREEPLGDPWSGNTVRSLLQIIGTELFRNNINKDVWALSLWLRINAQSEENWAITDVRFPNEKEVLSNRYNGKITTITVSRPGCDGSTSGGIKGHESENYSIPSDFSICNDGSIIELYKQVDEVMNECGLISLEQARDREAIITSETQKDL
ncbi:MAG: hypothetical protein M0R32_03620 [Candidatus Cloacimonetes bacterium]|jgi:hypothetical protein|nr:hypothetical protein [Candidatus Cloacimonadota bacterium]